MVWASLRSQGLLELELGGSAASAATQIQCKLSRPCWLHEAQGVLEFELEGASPASVQPVSTYNRCKALCFPMPDLLPSKRCTLLQHTLHHVPGPVSHSHSVPPILEVQYASLDNLDDALLMQLSSPPCQGAASQSWLCLQLRATGPKCGAAFEC